MNSSKPLACVRCGAPVLGGFECDTCATLRVAPTAIAQNDLPAEPRHSDGPKLALSSLLGLLVAEVLVYGAICGSESAARDKDAAASKQAAREARWARKEEERGAQETQVVTPPPPQQVYVAPVPTATESVPRYFAAVFTCTRCSRSCYAPWTSQDGSRDSFMTQATLICADFAQTSVASMTQHCPAAMDGKSCHVDVRFMDRDEVPASAYRIDTIDRVEYFF